MSRKRTILKGKGGKGYKILAAGKDRGYFVVTIPREFGFELGDRVWLYPMRIDGELGLFLRKAPAEVGDGQGKAGA